ncbi:CD225/dispanin family protein [Leyella stercorea]|uniref:CD225/dispanin family protein n=1 Tax=Leyella stercorea TaxID=363265 RepID=UPI00267292C4|nr:CD225/dispanin family protein [Leyella stercorea]
MSTLFCCLPLGIVAIIHAAKVDGLYRSGDYSGAQEAADNAKKICSIWSHRWYHCRCYLFLYWNGWLNVIPW